MKLLILLTVLMNTAFAKELTTLSKIQTKDGEKQIRIECSKVMCDEIFVNLYESGRFIEEINYIPLFREDFFVPLEGGRSNWGYQGTRGTFRAAGKFYTTSRRIGKKVAQPLVDVGSAYFEHIGPVAFPAAVGMAYMAPVAPISLGIGAVVFGPGAILYTGAGVVHGTSMAVGAAGAATLGGIGVLVGVGETLFYIGSDTANAISDIFNKQARALKAYKKVISGNDQVVKEKVFNEMLNLLGDSN